MRHGSKPWSTLYAILNGSILILAIGVALPLSGFSQIKPQASVIIGKWKLESEVNEDSSCVMKHGKEYQQYYQFLKDQTYKETTIRNDKYVKATYNSVGKWKFLEDSTVLLLYNGRADPPRKHAAYQDIHCTVKMLTGSTLLLHGAFSVCGAEGEIGTLHFVKVK